MSCCLRKKLKKCTMENIPLYDFKNENRLCKVLSVYDGDTITIAIKLETKIYKWKVRMYGYDSPEMKPLKILKNRDDIKRRALIAKKALEDKILEKIVTIELLGFDKYGRILGNIYYNNENINEYMLKNDYGYSYIGGTKRTI
tara:strand:- start:37 stop:465 length:429 start_codon:yes stop_codon:yes gene_type:complete